MATVNALPDSWLRLFQSGDRIHVSGFKEPEHNGAFVVISVESDGLTVERKGDSWPIILRDTVADSP